MDGKYYCVVASYTRNQTGLARNDIELMDAKADEAAGIKNRWHGSLMHGETRRTLEYRFDTQELAYAAGDRLKAAGFDVAYRGWREQVTI